MACQSSDKVPIVIVGNYCETPQRQRQVTYDQGQLMAEELHCAFVETSPQTGKNVELAFELMIAEIEKLQGNEPVASSSCTVQ